MYIVNRASDAHMKVYVVNRASEADMMAFIVNIGEFMRMVHGR